MTKKRTDYVEGLKWNVKDLYATEDLYNNAYQSLEKKLGDFAKFQGHILDSKNSLLELLELDNDFSKNLEQVYIYAHVQNDQDTTDTKFQTMYGKAYKLYERYGQVTSFIVPEILKNDKK